MLLGRTSELKHLNTYYDQEGSQIMVVYGQRNIGKTALLSSFVEDKPYHYYRARSASCHGAHGMLCGRRGSDDLPNHGL